MVRTAWTRRGGPKAVLAVLLALVAVLTLSALGLALPREAGAATASEKLSELRVRPAGSMDGYSRELFRTGATPRPTGGSCPPPPPTRAPATSGTPPSSATAATR